MNLKNQTSHVFNKWNDDPSSQFPEEDMQMANKLENTQHLELIGNANYNCFEISSHPVKLTIKKACCRRGEEEEPFSTDGGSTD